MWRFDCERNARASSVVSRGWCALVAILVLCGCRSDRATSPTRSVPRNAVPLLSTLRLPAVDPVQEGLDADGEDDGAVTIGPNLRALAIAERAQLVALPPPPATRHPVVCDILGFGEALYVAHVVQSIDEPGARIHRYDLAAETAPRWHLAFDWDREGAPPDAIGGVGGEGISRLRSIAGRIHAADADTPGPGGYRRTEARYEDYVFVSDERGRFPDLEPDMTPPANSRILPWSFHVFDVIGYRGALVASGGTGVYPSGPFPGGLWVGDTDERVWPVRFELGPRRGVVRTTFMHRFGGRLYIGFQNNRRRGIRPARFDLAVLTGDQRDPATPEPALARVTSRGGWLTRRFASGGGVLYWVASRYRRGTSVLFESSDGQTFHPVELPSDAGEVQDIAVVGQTRYVLTRAGVYRATGRGPFTRIVRIATPGPFARYDQFCSAPLVAYSDRLFAGATVDGRLFEIRPMRPTSGTSHEPHPAPATQP